VGHHRRKKTEVLWRTNLKGGKEGQTKGFSNFVVSGGRGEALGAFKTVNGMKQGRRTCVPSKKTSGDKRHLASGEKRNCVRKHEGAVTVSKNEKNNCGGGGGDIGSFS